MRRTMVSFGFIGALVFAACAPAAVVPAVGERAAAPPGPAVACAGNPGGPTVDGWMRRYPIFRNPQLASGGHHLRVPWRAVPHNTSIVMEVPPGDRLVVRLREWELIPVTFGPNSPELTLDVRHCFPTAAPPDLVVHHVTSAGDTTILRPKNIDYRQSRQVVVDVDFMSDQSEFILARP
jgi:hypothetical protein